MSARSWTPAELRKLDRSARIRLRDECVEQMSDPAEHVRIAAAGVLAELARVGGVLLSDRHAPSTPPRNPRPVSRSLEARTDDMREALYGPTDPTLAGRIAAARTDLYGSPDVATAVREQARAFHDIGGPSVEERRKRWDAAVALCGSPATARQRGYSEPEEGS